MTANLTGGEADRDATPEQLHKGRRLLWLGGAAIGVLIAMAIFVNLSRSRSLYISKETTFITEPLKSDGKQVDYFAAIRQATRPENAATDENGYRLLVRHLGEGQDSEPEHFVQICEALRLDADTLRPDMTYQEPYEFLNAYCESDQFDEALLDSLPPEDEALLDGLPPEGRSRDDVLAMLDDKLGRPWTLDELPMMASWLEQNGPALDLVGRAVRKPAFFIPLVRQNEGSLLAAVLLPELQRLRSFARGLTARAHYRIAVGDLDGAIDDIATCMRLGRHGEQGAFLIDLLVGIALEGIGSSVGIAGSLEHPPTKEQLERLLAEREQLPPKAETRDKVLAERFFSLDFIQAMAHGKSSWEELGFLNDPPMGVVARFGTDWNIVARRFNELFDAALTTGSVSPKPAITPGTAISFISIRARSEYLAQVLASLFWPGWEAVHEATRRRDCVGQMQHLALAMLLYERDHGTLPPAWLADSDGNPLHSWRVLLLPYLGHRELYEQIRLDEPWDSEHNRQFHREAPAVYRCPSDSSAGAGQTTYSVVVGPDMPFEAGSGKRLSDFGPHSDDMILLVERMSPAGWMEPLREVTQAAAEQGIADTTTGTPSTPDRIGSHHPGVANFGLRNGAVHALPADAGIDHEVLSKLLRGTNEGKITDF